MRGCLCILGRVYMDVGILCMVMNVTARESMEEAREHPIVETTGVANKITVA